MKRSLVFTLLILCTALCSATAFAAKIYKWVDNEGNVHYGERPPSEQAKELSLPKSVTTPRGAPAEQGTSKGEGFLETLDKERKQQSEEQAKQAEEQKVRKANCAIARRQEATLAIGGRIAEVDEKGERRFLSDEDIQRKLQEAREAIKKWCD